ncbi:MAG TPA: HAD-IA family hydrolase [Candidatus Limnocylindrales bacterium]|nr:HAD-IA family hydrolase [Candidatus Limnocylindrales bacterium]
MSLPGAAHERACEAILFDLDGTLIDSGGLYERHWRAWAMARGIDPGMVVALHFGRPAAETIRLVTPELDAVAEAARYNAELARDPDSSGVSVLEGAPGLLESLPAHRWAIVTSAPRVMVERWLRHLHLPFPGVLVTVDDVARGKPAPDPYLRAAELLGRRPERCLAIEDAPAGIMSARAAGAAVLAVASTHQPSDLAEADVVVAALSDIRVASTDHGLVVWWREREPGART